MKTCDQCVSVRINGLFAHEQGCPNRGKKWDRDEERWVRMVECRECGCDVEEGTSCSCLDVLDEDLDEEEHENEFLEILEKEVAKGHLKYLGEI